MSYIQAQDGCIVCFANFKTGKEKYQLVNSLSHFSSSQPGLAPGVIGYLKHKGKITQHFTETIFNIMTIIYSF